MKRSALRILVVLLVVVAGYTLFNQFDAEPLPLEFTNEGKLVAADYRDGNGFFTLWTLVEPQGVDVNAAEVIAPYRKLFDPRNADAAIRDFDAKGYHKKGKDIARRWQEYLKTKGKWAQFPIMKGTEWIAKVRQAQKEIRSLEMEFGYILARYRRMMENPFFKDLTIARPDSPVPNLLVWLRIAKLYNAVQILDALDGNWDAAASNLLDQLQSARKVVKGSRTLIANLVAKAEFRIACEALAALMSEPGCPDTVFTAILDRTPPLEFFEYGSLPLVHEYRFRSEYNWNRFRRLEKRSFLSSLWFTLFTQPNRTRNERDRIIAGIIKSERLEPCRWEKSPFDVPEVKRGWWWLRNPGGKVLLDQFFHVGGNSLATVILKSYRTRATFEMLRISAELHLKYVPEKPVEEILKTLESYRVMDPCSGEPYRWDDKKQVLYSIGTDRKDDGGRNQREDRSGDFPLQVILYIR